MKFTIEFFRVTCEKAFLEVEARDCIQARKITNRVSSDDQRLEFEPMSSTVKVASVWPAEFKSEIPS